MGGLLSRPKSKKPVLPKQQPPPAIPEEMPETEEGAMRKARRRKGFARTILTGALSPEMPGKKSLLG